MTIARLMSFLLNAWDTTVHVQDSPLTAVGGDQNSYNHTGGSTTIAGPQHFAGNQNIYQAAPSKGIYLPQLIFILFNDRGLNV